MTPRQRGKYWTEWQRIAAPMRTAGKTRAQIDAYRHEVTAKALGSAKSSKHLNNTDLDKVYAAFAAIHSPADFNAQMQVQDSPDHRRSQLLEDIDALAEDCGIEGGREGVASYFKRMLSDKAIEDLSERDLQRLRGILQRRARQLAPETEESPF